MPKVIPNLRETLLSEAKKLLLDKGYSGFTIHDVAKSCKIADGTLYNYFQSKQVLVGFVILADWEATYKKMQSESEQSPTLHHCLKMVYNHMAEFILVYEKLFFSSENNHDARHSYLERHEILIDQIVDILKSATLRLECNVDEFTLMFFAENIITYNMKKCPYESIEGVFNKLLS